MTNRLREIREQQGLSVPALAVMVNATTSKIYKLESGKQQLTQVWLQRLSRALTVGPTDILGNGASLPVAFTVASAFAGVSDDLPEPHERVVLPHLARPGQCFAAHVADGSCDGLWPQGTVLVARDPAALERPLRVGDKVIVRRRREDGTTLDILAGILDCSLAGDLSLLLRSSDRELPLNVVIRHASDRRSSSGGTREAGRGTRYVPPGNGAARDPEIGPYDAGAGDRAEILGRVVLAITPED